jgi:branched-chain amino acid transport system ATP-binding protein
MFELRHISKAFGGVKALDDINLSVNKGEIRGIIGSNGAGKTTLFNVITGELKPEEGEIILFDRPLNNVATRKRISMGIGRTYQIPKLFLDLTVEENIFLSVNRIESEKTIRFFHHWRHEEESVEKVRQLAERVGLIHCMTSPVDRIAYGDQRKLDIAMAIAGNPKMLLLDEPMAGLSLEDRPMIAELIRELGERIDIILLIEHDLGMTFDIVDKVIVLHLGRMVAQGTPEEIRANSDVQNLYKGGFQE